MLLQTKYVFFIFLEPKHFKLTQSDVVTGERRDGEPPPSETAPSCSTLYKVTVK